MSLLHRVRDRVLEVPAVYLLWQAPFAAAKLKPFRDRVGSLAGKRVLDVGCGPGTNAAAFAEAEYVGVDINPEYIARAQRRFRGRFLVGDVCDPAVLPEAQFDIVFANSLMHHLDDGVVDALLQRMAAVTAPGGRVHLLDLVLPDGRSPARALARLDRGAFARPVADWRAMFSRHCSIEHESVFPLGVPGVPLWWMIYLVGTPR